MLLSVLNANVDSTARPAEVILGLVMIYTCDERTTDGGVFDGNAYLSINCEDSDFLKCFNMFRERCDHRMAALSLLLQHVA